MFFVEYFTIDDASAALELLKNEKIEFGKTYIFIKAALAKVNASRNWSLRAAEQKTAGGAKY